MDNSKEQQEEITEGGDTPSDQVQQSKAKKNDEKTEQEKIDEVLNDMRLVNEQIRQLLRAGLKMEKVKEIVTDRLTEKKKKATVEDDPFFDVLFDALQEEAEEEYVDQLSFEVMKDPVVLSSGIVLDKATCYDEDGQMRLQECPITRQKLKKEVYPLSFLKGKLIDWRLKRFDSAIALADQYKEKPVQFEMVCEFANQIMEEMDEGVYGSQASRLAKLQLQSKNVQDPVQCIKIFSRVYKSLGADDQQKFMDNEIKEILTRIDQAIDSDDYSTAETWLKTLETLNKNGVPTKYMDLYMKMGKKRNEMPEKLFQYIKLSAFQLAEQGKDDEVQALLDQCEIPEEFRAKLILPMVEPKISALSAGFESGSIFQFTLNGEVFDNDRIKKNVEGTNRGMNLILVDRLTHEVTHCQSYDTYDSDADDSSFYQVIKDTGPDQIIVLMVSECGAVKLSKLTRDLIESMGSQHIQGLGYREPFAMIGCWSSKVKLLEDKNQKLRHRFAVVKNFD